MMTTGDILIVDDERDIRSLIGATLRDEGLHRAASRRSAIGYHVRHRRSEYRRSSSCACLRFIMIW